jgi:hypothetical protein
MMLLAVAFLCFQATVVGFVGAKTCACSGNARPEGPWVRFGRGFLLFAASGVGLWATAQHGAKADPAAELAGLVIFAVVALPWLRLYATQRVLTAARSRLLLAKLRDHAALSSFAHEGGLLLTPENLLEHTVRHQTHRLVFRPRSEAGPVRNASVAIEAEVAGLAVRVVNALVIPDAENVEGLI